LGVLRLMKSKERKNKEKEKKRKKKEKEREKQTKFKYNNIIIHLILDILLKRNLLCSMHQCSEVLEQLF